MIGNLDDQAIFDVARKIDSREARRAYLLQVCGNDQELERRIEGLLRAYDENSSFLEFPHPDLGTCPTIDRPIVERPGTVIGPYKLLEQIGEGGFGIVFMAEQQQPIRRRVALKILKPGMDTRQVIARFEAERQALAIMDHPNIAKVLDGGATESGRPYVVMDLVKGVPITDHCDQNRLSPRERLELFVSVCQAVQHAHHKGIIHRDLKPSNVLVEVHDTIPVVKVIDFGVAKALGGGLTDKTLFTGFAQMIGTPLYMSPEQAGQSGLDIDTRSDIYSLGVLLYELLTGTTPFDRQRFKEAAYDEIRRIICNEDPPKPSTRISTSAGLPSIAANRGLEPNKLTVAVRGELDWIVMRCLEKDRNRRYETANNLAHDIEHYLHDEPVQACPPSAMYRFRKFARRNKAALATATALIVTAIVAVGSLLSAVRVLTNSNARIKGEQKQTQEALGREKQANDQLLQARAAAVADAYRALLGETQALRFTRAAGWRETAMNNLRRLATMDTPQRDLVALRSEAVACLNELDAREILRLEGHTELAYGLDFSPDGKTLASAGYDGRVCLWDLADGRLIRQIADSNAVSHGFWTSRTPLPVARFHPRDDYLAYTTWDRGIGFQGCVEKSSKIQLLRGEAQPRDIAFDLKGALIAVSWGDGKIGLYDSGTGAAQRVIAAQTPSAGFYMPIALSPGGDLVASRGPGEVVQLHTVAKESEPRKLGRHAALIRSLAFSPDGKRVASASEDRTAKLWDVQSGKELLTLQGHTSKVTSIAFSPDGELAATGSDDSTLRIWGTRTGQALLVIRSETGPPETVAFSPDGTRVATAFKDLVVYQLEGRIARHLPGHGFINASLTFHPRKPILVSASRSNDVTGWDLTTGRELGRWSLPGLAGSLAFSPDGKLLAAAPFARIRMPFWMTGDVSLFEAQTGRLRKCFAGTYTAAIAFDPASRRLALGEHDGNVSIHDADSGDRLQRAEVMTGWITEVAFVNDSSQLLVSEVGGSLSIWDFANARASRETTLAGGLPRFAVDRNQRHVAVADFTGTLRILTLPDFKLVATLQSQPDFGWVCPAFSSDGRWLAAGGLDRRVTIYDASTFQKVLHLPSQNSSIFDIAFQPGGLRLAVCGGDEVLTVWDLSQFEPALSAVGLGWAGSRQTPVTGSSQQLPSPVLRSARGPIKAHVPIDAMVWAAEQTLQTYPDQPNFCTELAWIHVMGAQKFRDAPKALPLARRAVQLAPKEPLCWNTLGVVHYRLGQWTDAAETLRKSARINRDGPTAYDLFFLAMTHWQTGERKTATEYYDQAVSWSHGQTRIPPHEIAELRAIRAEADALFKSAGSEQPNP